MNISTPTRSSLGSIRRTGYRLALVSTLTVAAALVSAPLAVADNVQNNVAATGIDTVTVGASTAISYRISATSNDLQQGCNANDGGAATVSIVAPAAVTVTPASLVFTTCGTLQAANFSSSTAGNYPITVTVTDPSVGGGSYTTGQAAFTLKVVAPAPPPPPTDTTAPVASPTQSPLANGAGWNNSAVTVDWNWADEAGGSGIDAAACQSSSLSTGEGVVTLTASCRDMAGNVGQASRVVMVDTVAPNVSASVAPAPNASGWNNTAVTVSYSATDDGSGVAGCAADSVLANEGIDQAATGSCTDVAGNSGSATASGINIDLTGPNVDTTGGPVDGGSYFFGSVPTARCVASDDLSGLAGSCSTTGYSAATGTHTLTASAADTAGNATTQSVTYTVKQWTLNGFFAPVDMGSIVNTVKGGSTVPLKFRIFADSELTDTTAVTAFAATPITCASGLPSAPVEELAPTGSTILRYDNVAQQFVYNWKTPRSPGTCYKVTMKTQDGSALTALFKLS